MGSGASAGMVGRRTHAALDRSRGLGAREAEARGTCGRLTDWRWALNTGYSVDNNAALMSDSPMTMELEAMKHTKRSTKLRTSCLAGTLAIVSALLPQVSASASPQQASLTDNYITVSGTNPQKELTIKETIAIPAASSTSGALKGPKARIKQFFAHGISVSLVPIVDGQAASSLSSALASVTFAPHRGTQSSYAFTDPAGRTLTATTPTYANGGGFGVGKGAFVYTPTAAQRQGRYTYTPGADLGHSSGSSDVGDILRRAGSRALHGLEPGTWNADHGVATRQPNAASRLAPEGIGFDNLAELPMVGAINPFTRPAHYTHVLTRNNLISNPRILFRSFALDSTYCHSQSHRVEYLFVLDKINKTKKEKVFGDQAIFSRPYRIDDTRFRIHVIFFAVLVIKHHPHLFTIFMNCTKEAR